MSATCATCATCEAAVHVDGETIACGRSIAPLYEALSWGGYYGAPDLTVCERHAREALGDGARVDGPLGSMRLNEDGDLEVEL